MGSNQHEHVEVEVLVDGRWWPGLLDPDYWRQDGAGRWQGFVRWTEYPGDGFAHNRLGSFDQDLIRQT